MNEERETPQIYSTLRVQKYGNEWLKTSFSKMAYNAD